MDLLDLYHAHEHSLTIDKEYEVEFETKIDEKLLKSDEKREKVKKAKFVPWEPFKAAPSKDRKGECPQKLPNLIAYHSDQSKNIEENNNCEIALRDERRQRKTVETSHSQREMKLEDELNKTREELDIERKLNVELKKLMVATLSDELQGQVDALTEDKVRLGHRVDEYMGRLVVEDEESDRLRIDRDVWKCKFLAQSIRCDELNQKCDRLVKLVKYAQDVLKNKDQTSPNDISEFVSLDLQSFFDRSPCESRVRPKQPNFSNLTISCCANCTGREIKLL